VVVVLEENLALLLALQILAVVAEVQMLLALVVLVAVVLFLFATPDQFNILLVAQLPM
jgi:hypothetical protein